MICSSANLQTSDFFLVGLAIRFILIQLHQQWAKVQCFIFFLLCVVFFNLKLIKSNISLPYLVADTK